MFMTVLLLVLSVQFIVTEGDGSSKCAPNECLSQYGYCGTNSTYCGEGCKGGPCTNSKTTVAPASKCAPNECLSQYGYCGTNSTYCGEGCKGGPCLSGSSNTAAPPTPGTSATVSSVFDENVFKCIFSELDSATLTKRFDGLKTAASKMKWTPADDKQEIAAFLAHVSHETDGLKTYIEYCKSQGTCDNYQKSPGCSVQAKPGKQYFGRGWLQLSYPCNYEACGKAIGLDLLSDPDLVNSSDEVAAQTGIWFWQSNGLGPLAVADKFGETTKKLNVYECTGHPGHHMQAKRISTYKTVRKCYGLPESTGNLEC
ncbi:unnamed protein product [Didymodactylos carnosus]|uniref:Chitin-binding type-1 domain-containing protein n=1 Tax=Didymodactylos carnosus TaxID=1234261 RepID=A0A8S2E8K7_9BILA|nr:unnamed protein product [Didymodactylos carnosus]CAF3893132.1 unnamed protein product [Didymodactylos carnosus]